MIFLILASMTLAVAMVLCAWLLLQYAPVLVVLGALSVVVLAGAVGYFAGVLRVLD